MRIESITLHRVAIPFRSEFFLSHSRRRSSTCIVVEVAADGGRIKGYGEGLPVEAVTGETPETVLKDVAGFAAERFFPRDLAEVVQVWDFMDRMPPGKEHNAALCAMEMALLDALGKAQGLPVLDYLPRRFFAPSIQYGAVITLGDRQRVAELCKMTQGIGIRRLRVKMGLDFEQNKRALETVEEFFGPHCEQRVDPNGIWDFSLAMRHLPLLKRYRVGTIEEPMARTSPGFGAFARAARAEGMTLMACESAPTLEAVEEILAEGHYGMFNVKLCRSGGFRRTLQIVDHLRSRGIPFQIGCTLGEAGLLSAAGRALGLACSDAVTWDGSYDRFILEENIIEEDVGFGEGGRAGPLGGAGLGVKVSAEKLTRLSDFSTILAL